MPGYTMQSRGTARTSLPQARRLHLTAWKKVAYPQFATVPVWAQNRESQPSKVYFSHNTGQQTSKIFLYL